MAERIPLCIDGNNIREVASADTLRVASIIPNIDSAYDMGNDVTRFRNLYMSANSTIFLGGIEMRDQNGALGIFDSVGNEANLNTSVSSAATLSTARDFSLTGDVTASAVSFDGSGNVALSTTVAAGVITSNELASASTLLIKDASGTTLKTVIGAGV